MIRKQAALGGEPQKAFEQSFATLAYSYISDRVPGLMPYLVGFQLLEKSDDNQRAAGIFGFKVDQEWYDVPVFFLEGSIKGHSLLFVRNQNQFVPLKENWVNYLIGKKPSLLGKVEPKTQSELGARHPDLYRLRIPPSQLKYGSLDWPLPWVKEAASAWNQAIYGSVPKVTFDLEKIAERSPTAAYCLVKWAVDSPHVCEGIQRFYGDNALIRWLRNARVHTIKRQKSAVALLGAESSESDSESGESDQEAFVGKSQSRVLGKSRKKKLKPDLEYYQYLMQLNSDSSRSHPIKRSGLEIYPSLSSLEFASNLTDAEREAFARKGFLIRDYRPLEKAAVLVREPTEFTTVPCTGRHRVLWLDGSLRDCIIAKLDPCSSYEDGFTSPTKRLLQNLVVVDLGSKRFIVVSPSREVVTQQRKTTHPSVLDEPESQLSGLPSETPDTIEKGGVYLFLWRNGNQWHALSPVEVVEKSSQNGSTVIKADPHSWPKLTIAFGGKTSTVQFSVRRGGDSVSVVFPAGKRDHLIVKLSDPDDCPQCHQHRGFCYCAKGEKLRGDASELATLSTVLNAFVHGTRQIKVARFGSGDEVLVSGMSSPLRLGTAVVYLVDRFGLREKDAEELVQRAYKQGSASLRIKRADRGSLVDQGTYGPQLWPDDVQSEEQFGFEHNIQGRTPVEITSSVPGRNATETFDPFRHDPRYPPPLPAEAQMLARQAVQLGQKDIFDAGVLTSLLRTRTEGGLVDQYLGDLIKAVDRLGRILFKLYWHIDKFEERYGKQELPELEDSLLYSFEALGDLTLFLMKRTVAPFSIGEEQMGPSLESTGSGEGE